MVSKIIAAILLLLLCPVLLIISLIIFIQIGENPIFIQERGLTLSKYRFKIYKFRTMTGTVLPESFNNTLRRISEKESVFSFGKFLRKTGLDELPQLINIIKGEMNFVGPRPLDLIDLRNIKNHSYEQYLEREKLELLPGVTGFWQVYKNAERSIKNLIDLDKYYFENKSLKLNLKIIYNSVVLMLKAKHKDSVLQSEYFKMLPQYQTAEQNYPGNFY